MTMIKYTLNQGPNNRLSGIQWHGSSPAPIRALDIVAIIAGLHPQCNEIEKTEVKWHKGYKPRHDHIILKAWWKDKEEA